MPARIAAALSHFRGAAAVLGRGMGRYFDSAGVSIRYFERGAGDAVVLIHGFTRAAAAWSAAGVVKDLARDHRVLALDCRGHGRSGKPVASSRYGTAMADDIVRLLDHTGIQSAHVIGHSMGGRIALRVAASYPERILSAVLIASGGTLASQAENDPMPIDEVAASLESGAGFEPLLRAVLPPDRPLPRWKIRLLSRAASVTNDVRALVAIARGFRDLAVTDAELAGLRVPVSAIVGSRDPYQGAVAALARLAPAVEARIVPGATHLDVIRHRDTLRLLRESIANSASSLRRAA